MRQETVLETDRLKIGVLQIHRNSSDMWKYSIQCDGRCGSGRKIVGLFWCFPLNAKNSVKHEPNPSIVKHNPSSVFSRPSADTNESYLSSLK